MNVLIKFFLRKTVAVKKFVVLVVFCVILLTIYGSIVRQGTSRFDEMYFINNSVYEMQQHVEITNSFYHKRQVWTTSNLGSILFKNIDSNIFKKEYQGNKTFTILIWKYWDWLQNRHLYSFGSSRVDSSLNGCSVKNCIFTKTDQYLGKADAVVVHLQHGIFPTAEKRSPHQRWVFLSDESPLNTFSLSKETPKLEQLKNIFNWSMTYRSDSDVPVPYGRTLPLPEHLFIKKAQTPRSNLIPGWNRKRRDVLMAILMSNCAVSYRMEYLNELRKHIDVDVHGRCSENLKNSCPGHFRSDCPIMSDYLFYLVLENSMCREYLTEKAFYHAYQKGAIPVIMGPSVQDCNQILPPNSFLHVDNYANPQALAAEIKRLSNDIPTLLAFHDWRRHFEVVNDHGYFGSKSQHYCRICEALNYNDDTIKVYDENNIRNFLDPSLMCKKIN